MAWYIESIPLPGIDSARTRLYCLRVKTLCFTPNS